ncbi:NAD-dependent dehydratase [Bacillus manliponensis]|uniref:NAD-dependent dehydratase n=1 Tax=Bacillus manliponensis TaxID=574376 RepID=A0A073K2R3_9BACI|nr:NAD-dependent epimerase/dehydratase family protein [Bacillus manliponensis]KEK20747.1 NAD-dependent dehydratase [Bacillus manliponensis]
MKVLVLGGTRFFGKKLVQLLLADNCDVTIATRGVTKDSFGDKVRRIQLDRTNAESLKYVANYDNWDVIYDNICYAPNDALHACEVFANKVKRYIFTSTMAVYEPSAGRKIENEFNPYTYPITLGDREDFSYDEGKKLSEAVFFQKASFPICAVRFPIVLGEDDYTKRLQFHIEHIEKELPIGVPNKDALLSFIHCDEAAAFLCWLKEVSIEGPINACSHGEMSVGDIIATIEKQTDKQAKIEKEVLEENFSPFGFPDSCYMDTTKALQAGFSFRQLNDWYPKLVNNLLTLK